MEKHVCTFNEKWGIGEKEESFIEQGHKLGLRKIVVMSDLPTFRRKLLLP